MFEILTQGRFNLMILGGVRNLTVGDVTLAGLRDNHAYLGS